MVILAEIKIVLIISIMLLIPGWAFLAASGLWRRFEVLQRWFLAIGISIAFYPILFYTARTILPNLRIGDTKLILMLILMGGVIFWFMRKSWREQFQIGKWGGLVLAVLGATLFTRLILAHQYPYPAWTDSLHHTLITNLVAINGRLPYNLLPFSQTNLDQYHLGMYALTGSLQLLSDEPSHTALLWMSQVLNGLCGIGVFLFLDRKVSRLAGLAGMVFVGLLSFQPAWYFNWGRFTQASSQTILLMSALITWETLEVWGKELPEKKYGMIVYPILTSLLISSVFLLHFRVAGNLIPLLAIITTAGIIEAIKTKSFVKQSLISIIIIVIISVLLISPVLIPALGVYIGNTTSTIHETKTNEAISLSDNPYFTPVNLYNTYMLGVRWWFIALGALGSLFGLRKKNRTLVIITLTWIIFLVLEGNAYMFDIPILAFTNAQEVIIMLYLPASILMGILTNEIYEFTNKKSIIWLESLFIWLLLFTGFIGSYYRIAGVEENRFFMTDQDKKAMVWIRENTPNDAVFAIHTNFWLPAAVHGTDGGYWIPYFAERKTTTDTMISSFSPEYDVILERSKAVLNLYNEVPNVNKLCALGIDYIYDGAKDSFDGKSFNLEEVKNLSDVDVAYNSEGVTILKICN